MITCQLTKLETALEQVRKAYPKLQPTDAALVASALSLAGRHAIALYEGEQYAWPEDYSRLAKAMLPQIEMTQEPPEGKKSKAAAEEEVVYINVGLAPNLTSGEKLLDGFDSLKSVLSDAIQEGVEFVYQPSDIMWQWALDRVTWSTVMGRDLVRKVKVRTAFTEGAVGVEMGTGAARKRKAPTKAEKAEAAEAEAAEVAEAPGDAEA